MMAGAALGAHGCVLTASRPACDWRQLYEVVLEDYPEIAAEIIDSLEHNIGVPGCPEELDPRVMLPAQSWKRILEVLKSATDSEDLMIGFLFSLLTK